MKTYIQEKLSDPNNNRIKELFSQTEDALTFNMSKEEFFEFIYDQYIDHIKDKQLEFNEEEFCELIENGISFLKLSNEKINSVTEKISESKIVRAKVSLVGYDNIYRIIEFSELMPISYLAYSIIASFNAGNTYDYDIHFNSATYISGGNYKESQLDIFNADEYYIDSLHLNVNDKFIVNCNIDWEFEVEVTKLKVIEDLSFDEFPSKIKKIVGPDIIDEDRDLFDALLKDDLDKAKKVATYPEKLDEHIEYFKNQKYSFTQKTYEERIEKAKVFFGDETNEDDEEPTEEELEKMRRLVELPQIQKYISIKDLYSDVSTKLWNYFNENSKKYYQDDLLEKIEPIQIDIPTNLNISNLENDDMVLLLSSLVYPIGEDYESVSDTFYKNNLLKGKESKMLESMRQSKVGIYKISLINSTEGQIILKNLVNDEVEIVYDINILFAYEGISEYVVILARIFEYDSINFLDQQITLFNDIEVQDLIEEMKTRELSQLEYYLYILIMEKKQQRM